jgi:soluble lytic murein transglycosylase-like protein
MAVKVTAADIPVGLRFYKALIVETARKYQLDPVLIAAMSWQESSLQTDAYRFEPDFWNRYLKPKPEYRDLNPRRVSASYGLLQVMYCRVHEDKLTDNDALPPEHLFVPELGLDTGCALFAELLGWAKARTIPAGIRTTPEFIALCAYNGGRGGNDPAKNWPLRNASYARGVLEKFTVLQKEKIV